MSTLQPDRKALADLQTDLAACMAMVERSSRGSVMYPSEEFPAAAASLLIRFGDLIRALAAPASPAEGWPEISDADAERVLRMVVAENQRERMGPGGVKPGKALTNALREILPSASPAEGRDMTPNQQTGESMATIAGLGAAMIAIAERIESRADAYFGITGRSDVERMGFRSYALELRWLARDLSAPPAGGGDAQPVSNPYKLPEAGGGEAVEILGVKVDPREQAKATYAAFHAALNATDADRDAAMWKLHGEISAAMATSCELFARRPAPPQSAGEGECHG